MASPTFLYSDYRALTGGVEAAAKTWQDMLQNLQGSETAKAYGDQDYFQREADVLSSSQLRSASRDTLSALQAQRARTALSGLQSIGEKGEGRIAAAGVGRGAAISAEFSAGAERKRTANEARYLNMVAGVDAAFASVGQMQQALSRRLGEQSQYDEQYKNEIWHEAPGEYAQQYYAAAESGFTGRAEQAGARERELAYWESQGLGEQARRVYPSGAG